MAWRVDPDHSKIEFLVKHLVVTRVRGEFRSFEGTLHIDEVNPEVSSVEGTVDVTSLKTPISLRDANLRSGMFFDARSFPKMSFRSTRVGPFEGDKFQVRGEMTIRDVTREVVFDVVDKGEMPAAEGKRRWAFGASITLNRKVFGLAWHPLIEVGGLAVGDEVEGIIEIQAVQD